MLPLRGLCVSLCAMLLSSAAGCQFFGIDTRPEIRYVTEKERKNVTEPMYSMKVRGTNLYKQWPVKRGADYGFAPWEKKPVTATLAEQRSPAAAPARALAVHSPAAMQAPRAQDAASASSEPGESAVKPQDKAVRKPSQVQRPKLVGAVATPPARADMAETVDMAESRVADASDLAWRPTAPDPEQNATPAPAKATKAAALRQPGSVAPRVAGISKQNPIRDAEVTPAAANEPPADLPRGDLPPDLVPPADELPEGFPDAAASRPAARQSPDQSSEEGGGGAVVRVSDDEALDELEAVKRAVVAH